jgi:hypothetical protein
MATISALEKSDTMEERIGRIRQIRTDFLESKCADFKPKNQKKSVSICPIRPIRSPIVSLFSKSETAET